jgi:DnaJ-domain-containing protein 1
MSVFERLSKIIRANAGSGEGGASFAELEREFKKWERILRDLEREALGKADGYKKKFEDYEFNDPYSNQAKGQSKSQSNSQSNNQSNSQQSAAYDPIATYYANLEVPYGADLNTVRTAWRKLVRQYHPDKFSADPERQKLATELTKGLNFAYQELEKHLQKK